MAKLVMIMVVLVVLVVLATTSLTTTEAQSVPTCANQLVPCYSYLNSTGTPPDSCCNPIKEAVATELACLCTLYTTPGLLASFNISVAQALKLTENCGVPTDISACNNVLAPPPTSSVTPPPPGVPGNDGGISAGRITWTGVLSVILFWGSIILY